MRLARSGWRTSGGNHIEERIAARVAVLGHRHAGLPGEPAFPAAAEHKLMPGLGGNGVVREVQRWIVQPVGCCEWWLKVSRDTASVTMVISGRRQSAKGIGPKTL
jgi:hypothetical protein